MTSLKEEAAKIILESAKKRVKAIPPRKSDIGDPDAKVLAVEEKEIIVETLPPNAKAGDWVKDFVHSRNKMFSHDSKKKRIQRALAGFYRSKRGE